MLNKLNDKKQGAIRNALGAILIALGIIIILSSLVINIRQTVMKEKAITEYKSELSSASEEEDSQVPGSSVEGPVSEGDVLGILRIPAIDSENLIREGVASGILADSLGHEPATAYVGQPGNCVIAGHRNYTFGKFFNRLDEVAVGDEIYVDTLKGTYQYKVCEIKTVRPEEVEILQDTEGERLTLYTCTPIYIASHRLVIIAKRAY